MESNEGKLRKVPECGTVEFNDKIESIPEDTLVTTQAKREYLAHVWAQYKCALEGASSPLLLNSPRSLARDEEFDIFAND